MDKQTKRWWDWLAASCLLIALMVVSIRLDVTNWTDQLYRIEFLVLVAVVLGLALGFSKFSAETVQVMALVFTLCAIPWQLGLSVDNKLADEQWTERLSFLGSRLGNNLGLFFSDKPVMDNILFLSSMALLFWLIGLIAGYQLARHGRPWVPLLVAGIALLVIDYYNPFLEFREGYSGLFVFLVLLLVGRMYFLSSRNSWKEQGTTVDSEIGFDFNRGMAVSGLVIVLIAWNVPVIADLFSAGAPAREWMTRTWDVIGKRLSNAVVGLQSPAVVTSDFYGDALSLGTGASLGDDVIFTVQVNTSRPEGLRYYWRGHSYDTFKDGQWRNTLTEKRLVSIGKVPFTYPEWQARRQVTLTVTMRNFALRTIYFAGLPLSFSRQVSVLLTDIGEGSVDVSAVLAEPQLRAGESFRINAWVTAPTASQLKAASSEYPTWVTQHFLQIPDTLSLRVKALARNITAGKDTPFDKVMAITQYLRQNITYEQVVPNPPANRDLIDWFLFDMKKGFCNYYATAEVMMLRSLGIPARLSVGYAEGEGELSGDLFTVRSRDSHAWPEIYFPGYGWVEFEPTVSQPATGLIAERTGVNPSETNLDGDFVPNPIGIGNDEEVDAGGGGSIAQPRQVSWLVIVLVVGLIGSGTAAFFWIRSRQIGGWKNRPVPTILVATLENRGIQPPDWLRWWAHRSELSPIERLFQSVGWMVRIMGKEIKPAFTPAEQIEMLKVLLPGAEKPAQELLYEYHKAIYSPYPANYGRANLATMELWRMISRSWIKQRIGI